MDIIAAKPTALEYYTGKSSKLQYSMGNRFYFKKTGPDEVYEIEDSFEGIVIPDKDYNVTVQWRNE